MIVQCALGAIIDGLCALQISNDHDDYIFLKTIQQNDKKVVKLTDLKSSLKLKWFSLEPKLEKGMCLDP